jgi:hypothetical protein
LILVKANGNQLFEQSQIAIAQLLPPPQDTIISVNTRCQIAAIETDDLFQLPQIVCILAKGGYIYPTARRSLPGNLLWRNDQYVLPFGRQKGTQQVQMTAQVRQGVTFCGIRPERKRQASAPLWQTGQPDQTRQQAQQSLSLRQKDGSPSHFQANFA